MSLPSLLTVPTNKYAASTYAFEQRMVHRELALNMPPVDRFSVAPYLLDPQVNTGGWLMNHAQAHNDFRTYLPVSAGWWYIEPQYYGVASNQNLMDVDLNNPEQVRWWVWVNHMDHYIAENLMAAGL